MVYKLFDKKSKGSGITTSLGNKSANESNYQLANKLHKPIIKKFIKKKFIHFLKTIWKRSRA